MGQTTNPLEKRAQLLVQAKELGEKELAVEIYVQLVLLQDQVKESEQRNIQRQEELGNDITALKEEVKVDMAEFREEIHDLKERVVKLESDQEAEDRQDQKKETNRRWKLDRNVRIIWAGIMVGNFILAIIIFVLTKIF